jgi:chemotaxis protein histidine kinase CheA
LADDFNNDSLLELYLYESTSLLDSLDDIMLTAEASRDLSTANINEIFRIMHTIKGSSAMMAYTGISEVAHKTEDLFSVIRNSGLNLEYWGELVDIVLAVSDFLKAEVAKVQDGLDLQTDVAVLTEVVGALKDKMQENAPEQPTADVGRTLGSAPDMQAAVPKQISQPDPVGLSRPEPVHEPLRPEKVAASMPLAPEGGRILGLDPTVVSAKAAIEPDLPAVAQRAVNNIGGLAEATTYFLHIHFNEGSKMEGIRAFMLVNKLCEKGTVNRTVPSNLENNADAANQIIERGFYVSFTTTMFREQIEALAKGTLSVETVSFVRKMPDDPSGSTGGAPEMPKPEPRPEPTQKQPEPAPQTVPSPQPAPPLRPLPAQEQEPPAKPRMHYSVDEQPAYATAQPQPQQAAPEPAPASRPVSAATAAQPTAHPPAPEAASLPASSQATPAASVQIQGAPAPSQSPANQSIISVELKKLDALLDLVGEIVINESIVTENPDLEGLEFANFRKAARQLDKLTDELQDTVMSIRMLPVSMVFQRMRRIVRDMSKSLGKEADLILVGETTEVDKTILDALSDPLMHLVRNAMDHAIESPEVRQAEGKNPLGHIILSAQNSGGDVIISVSDDGKGLDRNVILAKARANGLLRKPENDYSDKEIFNLLMAPGFSTKEQVSEFSGRGVGMDVVKSNIERIGGSVIIESKLGHGTNIILKIPLTLAIISCIEIELGGDIYSIPINNIRESFKADVGQVITDPVGNEMIMLRGEPYPIVRLYELFGRKDAVTDIRDGILVLVDAGDRSGCLLADNIIGKFQVVVKPLPTFLSRFGVKRSGISGCTIMGNGNISLIINVQDLVE